MHIEAHLKGPEAAQGGLHHLGAQLDQQPGDGFRRALRPQPRERLLRRQQVLVVDDDPRALPAPPPPLIPRNCTKMYKNVRKCNDRLKASYFQIRHNQSICEMYPVLSTAEVLSTR